MKKPLIIGISGNKGSFSEEAAEYYCYKNNIKNYKIDYLVNAKNESQTHNVLDFLNKGKIDLGIFPIQNSNGGIVEEAVYAMSKYNFHIKQIFDIDIKMNLMVKKGTKTADIKTIVSHSQALKQCRMYLKRIWRDTNLEEYSDTALAAKDLSQGKLSADCAVIAPKKAAKIYNLELLEEGIQDLKFNFTSFIAAKRSLS